MAYKSVNVEITQEHFDRSIKGSPKEAVKELIWNACDADAKNIEVSFDYDGIAGAESVSDIYVKDDGHGIAIDHIEEYFGKYGRSQKTYFDKSPGGRIYHGKLGQGRYKSLAAGNFLDWDSVFQDESGTLLHCEIHINSASRMNISYSETADKSEAEHTGTIVHIHGIPDEKIGFITKMAEPMETIPDLLATFAPYLLAYTNITIKYNGVTVDPAQQIKSQEDQELVYEEDGKEPIKARLSAITWKEAQFNKLYICGSSGVVYAEMDYTPLKRTSTSLYLMGDLFEQMHRDNTFAMGNTNPAYAYFEEEAKKFARALVGEQEEEDAAVEIARIKEIRDYALTVAENPMFDKTRTKWHFVLLGQRLDQHVQRALRNQTVGEGNFYNADNVSISVFEWSKIIQDNKLKYEYLRRKLNHQLSSDPNFASDYLRTKHAELFPTEE